ncbi:LADA_0H07558g1_1 [Lachancea dasiensis]|uniref:Mediator of RNA polymerase II transcription subunit 22 n=1 Tax=Lachancea dasiensis TaxID=1072105 RepID=A0A1G4K258_9SACH|nr:LADA_0H07558g1_1 [Lachancea dasiensis]
MSDRGLLEQLNRITDTLSRSLANLVKNSSISKEGDEDEHGNYNTPESAARTSTSGLMLVNAQTAQLIRGIQDLMVMTRTIREKWLLTQIPDENDESQLELDYKKCSQLLEQWEKEVLG